MNLNTIDRTKCQWAWVGDTKEEVENKIKKRLVYGIGANGMYLAVRLEHEERFKNNKVFESLNWKYAEFIEEPKTKIVPMTFEDMLCIEAPENCVVVYKSSSGTILNYFGDTWDIKSYSYTFFNKKTKTYGEWMPMTKEVEV